MVILCDMDNVISDKAFIEFNTDRPENFKGHSLSVSDIVEINGVKFYCDDFGWTEVA